MTHNLVPQDNTTRHLLLVRYPLHILYSKGEQLRQLGEQQLLTLNHLLVWADC